jgi:hypothetical protein
MARARPGFGSIGRGRGACSSRQRRPRARGSGAALSRREGEACPSRSRRRLRCRVPAVSVDADRAVRGCLENGFCLHVHAFRWHAGPSTEGVWVKTMGRRRRHRPAGSEAALALGSDASSSNQMSTPEKAPTECGGSSAARRATSTTDEPPAAGRAPFGIPGLATRRWPERRQAAYDVMAGSRFGRCRADIRAGKAPLSLRSSSPWPAGRDVRAVQPENAPGSNVRRWAMHPELH